MIAPSGSRRGKRMHTHTPRNSKIAILGTPGQDGGRGDYNVVPKERFNLEVKALCACVVQIDTNKIIRTFPGKLTHIRVKMLVTFWQIFTRSLHPHKTWRRRWSTFLYMHIRLLYLGDGFDILFLPVRVVRVGWKRSNVLRAYSERYRPVCPHFQCGFKLFQFYTFNFIFYSLKQCIFHECSGIIASLTIRFIYSFQ